VLAVVVAVHIIVLVPLEEAVAEGMGQQITLLLKLVPQ